MLYVLKQFYDFFFKSEKERGYTAGVPSGWGGRERHVTECDKITTGGLANTSVTLHSLPFPFPGENT